MFEQRLSGMVYVVVLILILSGGVFGTTVFVANHGASAGNVPVYELAGGELIYSEGLDVGNHGFGPVDVAIDEHSSAVFVSFEDDDGGGNKIVILDGRGLEPMKTETLSVETMNITGLGYDAARRKLYGTERNTNFRGLSGDRGFSTALDYRRRSG